MTVYYYNLGTPQYVDLTTATAKFTATVDFLRTFCACRVLDVISVGSRLKEKKEKKNPIPGFKVIKQKWLLLNLTDVSEQEMW